MALPAGRQKKVDCRGTEKRLDVVTTQPFQLLQSPVPTLEQLVPVLSTARKHQGTKLQIPPYVRTAARRGQ